MPVGSLPIELFIECENSSCVNQMLTIESQVLLEKPLSNESLKFCYLDFVNVEAFRNWLMLNR